MTNNELPEKEKYNTGPTLQIAQPKRWYILLCVLILLAALIIWSFVGRIPIEVAGKGVELNPEGVFSIEAKAPGIVTDIYVERGDVIDKSNLIMTIYNSKLSSIISHIRTTRYKIQQLLKELVILKESLNDKEELYKKGLIAKIIYTDALSRVMDKEIAIDEERANLTTLLSDLEKNSSCGKEEIEGREQELIDAEKEFDFLKIEKCMSSVYSPYKGTVLEVLVNPGTNIELKNPLVWMEHLSEESNLKDILFYAVIPVHAGGRIRPGMTVRIEPSTVNPQEYGAILGKVKEVSPFAISENELIKTLRNKQLVDYLVGKAPAVIAVTVEPVLSDKTPSGYEWTSSEGPPFKIPTGTVVTVKIIVEEQPPISYLIPLWKLKPKFD